VTIGSYNASAVKIYIASISQVRFENNIFFHLKYALAYYSAGVVCRGALGLIFLCSGQARVEAFGLFQAFEVQNWA
jgi:hypothetical protein